ncbi:hypothetical protein HPB50_017296 [Hyalomma asiaticum]|uniref:Uncharacterized protein n=1 Tax=Hyalomma asiaticum TaxID=266040 RepID=A0ACB7RLA1_HYAAI|nr:hypothetical protein HPB50_017296 [Hyalomma asiaticum]
MFALVTPSPPPPIILVQQQPDMGDEATPEVRAMRRRPSRDNSYAFPVEEFVEAVQQHRFLFDRNEPDFKNVARKEATWEAIGLQFGVSGKTHASSYGEMQAPPLRRFLSGGASPSSLYCRILLFESEPSGAQGAANLKCRSW